MSGQYNCQKPIFPTINAGRIAFIFCQLGVVYPILAPCNVIAAIVVITIAFFRDDAGTIAEEAQLIVISKQDCTAASSISVGIAGAVAIFTPGIIAAFISGTFGICIAFFITVAILLFELRLQLLDFAGCTAVSESKENRCTNKDKYSQLVADNIAADELAL